MTNAEFMTAPSWPACADAKTALDLAQSTYGNTSKEACTAGITYGETLKVCALEKGIPWP